MAKIKLKWRDFLSGKSRHFQLLTICQYSISDLKKSLVGALFSPLIQYRRLYLTEDKQAIIAFMIDADHHVVCQIDQLAAIPTRRNINAAVAFII